MHQLLQEIRRCQHCLAHLPHGVRPVVAAHPESKIAIIGQAPGRVVHETGIPWNDKSGERLRSWLDVDSETFYDAEKIALIPMGFCYPGTGQSGDLPPRPECAPLWHSRLFEQLPLLQLTLLVGAYAQKYYLNKKRERSLTTTVRQFEQYLPKYLPLPHPSPRNNIWLKKNPWFEEEVIPVLRERVQIVLHDHE